MPAFRARSAPDREQGGGSFDGRYPLEALRGRLAELGGGAIARAPESRVRLGRAPYVGLIGVEKQAQQITDGEAGLCWMA